MQGTGNQRGYRRALLAAFLALIAWAPVPLGSNRPWSAALVAGGALALLGAWLLGRVVASDAPPAALARARGPVALLAASCAYLLAQAVPLGADALGALSPAVAALSRDAASAGVQVSASLSVDRQATLAAFLGRCGQLALFVCTLALVSSRRRLWLLLTVLLLAGFANALYGLVAHFTSDWSGLWNPAGDRRLVTGTYVNRNHFAGLMEMSLAAGLGLVVAGAPGGLSWRRPRDLVRGLAVLSLSGTGRVAFYLVVMCAALLMSASRGGLVALVAGLAGAGALSASLGRGGRELGQLAVFACLLVAAAAWFGMHELVQRLDTAGFESNRADLRAVGYAMIRDAPWFGFGGGTFASVFPAYRGEAVAAGYYEHAHNDYLELWVEQGAAGFALWLGFVAWVYARMVQGLRRRRDRLARGALYAGLAGTLALLVHGLVDFNLQIPANAAFFHVLLAAGLVGAGIESAGSGAPRRTTGPLGVVGRGARRPAAAARGPGAA